MISLKSLSSAGRLLHIASCTVTIHVVSATSVLSSAYSTLSSTEQHRRLSCFTHIVIKD